MTRPGARACALASLFATAYWALLDARLARAATHHGHPIKLDTWQWDTGKTPLAHMVDVTNHLGLKILAEHSYLNENNIAFSPYGLMGILVALYEGVEGESSHQIQRALNLPWNRNIMRIGFRDIHRILKTYFEPDQSFLAGLTLNNENVTFNDSYKKILQFYGFDFENDKSPKNNSDLPKPTNGNDAATMQADATSTPQSTAAREDLSTTTLANEGVSPNQNADTTNDIDVRNSAAGPTNDVTSSMPNIDNIVSLTDTIATTDRSTIPMGETLATLASSATQTVIPRMETTAGERESIMTTLLADIDSENSTNTLVPSTTHLSETATTEQAPITIETSITPIETTEDIDTTVELLRRKKSIANVIFTGSTHIAEDDPDMFRIFNVPGTPPNFQQTSGQQMFLANGVSSVQVSYMMYDAVLEYAFLPHLEAAALRVPLAGPCYLLALLPAPARGLPRLLAHLRHSDLRDVYDAMRPTRVRAILPTFAVKGHVALTGDLQKMGIIEVFQEGQRDFAPMTSARGVRVRGVEQDVSVALRAHAAPGTDDTRWDKQRPVHFSATYPFLYFVMDASIHVALMAGQILNPLNSTIL